MSLTETAPYTIGTSFTYVCETNYEYTGDQRDLTVECVTGRSWSRDPPTYTGEIELAYNSWHSITITID